MQELLFPGSQAWDKNNDDAIVCDNQMGASDTDEPSTALGGGSIVIHKPWSSWKRPSLLDSMPQSIQTSPAIEGTH
jgi:hypothetical protein